MLLQSGASYLSQDLEDNVDTKHTPKHMPKCQYCTAASAVVTVSGMSDSKDLVSCGYSENLANCGYWKNLALAQKNLASCGRGRSARSR